MKVALLSKKTRGGTVVATMTVRFGDEKTLFDKATVADLAADMLMRGTTKHTRQQIKDELDRLKARMSVTGRATQANLTIETIHENFPAVLALAAEVLREPAFPPKEFEELQQENLAAIEQQRSEPDALGSNYYQRHMNPYPKGDVRYVETFEESRRGYKATSLEDGEEVLRRFLRRLQRRSSPSSATSTRPSSAAESAADLFANWKSPAHFERVPQLYKDVPAENKALETPDKANAFFIAGQNLPLGDEDPDYPALVLGNYMLGGGFLNSRLAVRIRQKDGLSYGVGSQVQASPLDKAGTFTTFAIYAPQNEVKLEAAFKEEIAGCSRTASRRRRSPKPSPAGCSRARSRARRMRRSPARSRPTSTSAHAGLGRRPREEGRGVTGEQILAAMRKYLDPSKMTIVKAGDFPRARARRRRPGQGPRFALARMLLSSLPALALHAGDPEPPTPKRCPTCRR